MIIDIHAHLGWDFTFEELFAKELLIDKMNKNDVIQIVQPGTTHDIERARSQHNEIAKLSKSFPGKFFGMAAPNPHTEDKKYEDEITRCVEDLEFIAIKLHTYATGVHPNSKCGRKVFNIAQRYRIPVMVHTGSGVPFAAPINLVPVAKDYPNVKIIMAHCGSMILADEAATALSLCPNIYGDTSWTAGYLLLNWVRAYGPKIMFASDLADNFETELAKIKTYGFTTDEQKSIFETTALNVFNLKAKLNKS